MMMMKDVNKHWGVGLLTAAMALLLTAGPVALTRAEDKKKEEVADHMEVISKSFKKIRRQMTKQELNKSSSELVATMIKHAEAAMKMQPPLAKDMSGEEKKKFLEAYQKSMAALIKGLGVLKKAFDENRNADVPAIYKSLLTMKKEGHEKFTE